MGDSVSYLDKGGGWNLGVVESVDLENLVVTVATYGGDSVDVSRVTSPWGVLPYIRTLHSALIHGNRLPFTLERAACFGQIKERLGCFSGWIGDIRSQYPGTPADETKFAEMVIDSQELPRVWVKFAALMYHYASNPVFARQFTVYWKMQHVSSLVELTPAHFKKWVLREHLCNTAKPFEAHFREAVIEKLNTLECFDGHAEEVITIIVMALLKRKEVTGLEVLHHALVSALHTSDSVCNEIPPEHPYYFSFREAQAGLLNVSVEFVTARWGLLCTQW